MNCLPCDLEGAEPERIVFRDDTWSCEVADGFDVPGWFILAAPTPRRGVVGTHRDGTQRLRPAVAAGERGDPGRDRRTDGLFHEFRRELSALPLPAHRPRRGATCRAARCRDPRSARPDTATSTPPWPSRPGSGPRWLPDPGFIINSSTTRPERTTMSTPFTHTATDGREYTGRTNLGAGLDARPGAPLVHRPARRHVHLGVLRHPRALAARQRDRRLGIPVIALDRPNYGGSSPLASDDSIILANADVIGRAIERALGASTAARHGGIVLDRVTPSAARSPPRSPPHPSHGRCSASRPPDAWCGSLPESAAAWAALPDHSDDRSAGADEGPAHVRARVDLRRVHAGGELPVEHPRSEGRAARHHRRLDRVAEPRSAAGSPFPSITGRASSIISGSPTRTRSTSSAPDSPRRDRSTPSCSPAAVTASTSTCPAKRSSAHSWSSPRQRAAIARRHDPHSARCPGLRDGAFGEPEDVAVDGGVIADVLPAGAAGDSPAGGYLIPGLIDCHIHLSGPETLTALATRGVTTGLDMSSPAPLVAALRGTPGVTDIRSPLMAATSPASAHAARMTEHPRRGGGARRRSRRGRTAGSPGTSSRAPTTSRSSSTCPASIRRRWMPWWPRHTPTACGWSRTRPPGCRDDGRSARESTSSPTHRSTGPIEPDQAAELAAAGSSDRPDADDDARHRADRLNAAGISGPTYGPARESVATLHAAGMPILAGTDANATPAAPASPVFGESLHDELALLVDAGLTPSRGAGCGDLRRCRALRADRPRTDRARACAPTSCCSMPTRPSTSPPPGRSAGVWIAGQQIAGQQITPPS